MKRDEFKRYLDQGVLAGDGAMGTFLQAQGSLKAGDCPDVLNLTHPEVVRSVHGKYVEAGSRIIQTNTFSANKVKLDSFGLSDKVWEINRFGMELAKDAISSHSRHCLIAGTIGPTGQLLSPFGPLSFSEAERVFWDQARVLIEGGADILLIETMSDLHEAKAAVVGAKRAGGTSIPIICSFTYTRELRTLTGADPETVATTLEGLGVDAIGVNCGFGPDLAREVLKRQYKVTDRPLLVQPNAGLPILSGGKTVYPLGPESFAEYVESLVSAGANIVGGCCGTTPAHIRLVADILKDCKPLPRQKPGFSKSAGTARTIYIGDAFPTPVAGERINPTGRKNLAEALRRKEFHMVANEARNQVNEGASLIDVNVGLRLPEVQESDLMEGAVSAAQRGVSVPLMIDSSDVTTLEKGLQACRGKPILNSASGRRDHLEQVTDLAAKYGAALIGLTLDESGIPANPEGRLEIAGRIVETALTKGIRLEDIYIDPLTMTVGAGQDQLLVTLESLRLIKSNLGVKTVLGISNVSHGMPGRDWLNNTFLVMALGAGLDVAIVNPAQPGLWNVILAADVLTNKDRQAKIYLSAVSSKDHNGLHKGPKGLERYPGLAGGKREDESSRTLANHTIEDICDLLVHDLTLGETDRIEGFVKSLVERGLSATYIIENCVISAMEIVGDEYQQGTLFLPQLLLAAEAAQRTFHMLRPYLEQGSEPYRGKVVLATVKGDIHDIGKSIVSLLLQNHGFLVIDLGKDVDGELIVDVAISENADIIGLSSLMTTTMPEMAKVAELARSKGLNVPILVGGAVVTAEYAESIGAFYAPDANQAVKVAKSLLKGGGT